MGAPHDSSATGRDRDFATTQWSLVVDAAKRGQRDTEPALATLCQRYWYPLYAYVRRRGANVDTAQDLTQEFFARLLEKNVLAHATPERGRFRAFLLTSMRSPYRRQLASCSGSRS